MTSGGGQMPQKVRLPRGRGHPSVDGKIHARDVGRIVRRQKRDCAGNFLRLSGAAERNKSVILRHQGFVAA